MLVTLPSSSRLPRLVLFGSTCHFTSEFLRLAVAHRIDIAAIVLSGPPGLEAPVHASQPRQQLPLYLLQSKRDDVRAIAMREDIPVYRVGRLRSDDTVRLIRSLRADVLLSVCFPRLIPPEVAGQVCGPSLNIHTSLLPSLRGPDPMFWTFKDGTGLSGVTIHEMSRRFDAGAIVAQQQHTYADGTSEAELESKLAEYGVKLLERALGQIAENRLQRADQLATRATYARFPTLADYRIEPSMPARSAFNFVRGLAARNLPFMIDIAGVECEIKRVHSYGSRSAPVSGNQQGTRIDLGGGYVMADLACESH